MKTRFIPSQRIKGSDKELFIINFEGSTFEIQRTSNIYEPVIIRLNGELLDTIPSKQNKEIEFSTPAGNHKIQIWNERVENNLIPKIFVKDGIAAVIDGIPVQNTLADPITRFKTGKTFIWLLTALLFLKAFIIPLTSQQLSLEGETRVFLFVNIILFVLSLSAALTFQLNPLRSVWIALVVSIIEFASYILAVVAIKEIDIVVILFTVLRLAILASLIFSLRNLKLILNFSDDEYQVASDKPLIPKRVKRFSIPKKYIAISLITLVILVGGYFAMTEIIKSSKYPSLDRDSSLEFRNDLKLPELIPYCKGDKWGFYDRNKKIIVEPIYSEVENFSKDKFWRVEKEKLVGMIDKQGNEVIPCKYKDIDRAPDSDLFIVENSKGVEGVIDANNNVIIPFDYKNLQKHPNKNIYIALKEKWGVIDGNNKVIIPFSYPLLEFCDNFLIAKKSVKDKTFYGLLNFDGSILLDFQSLILSKNIKLKSHLLVASIKRKLLERFSSEIKDVEIKGIIDSTGKIVLPIEYIEIHSYDYVKSDFIEIQKGSISYYPYEQRSGLINSDGKIIVPCEYYLIYLDRSNDEYILVENYYNDVGLYGVVNTWGMVEIPFQTETIWLQKQEDNYYFAIKDKYNSKMGLMDEYRKIIVPFEYDGIYISKKNWIIVYNNCRKGVVDFNNNLILPTEYLDVNGLYDDLAAVKYVAPDSIAMIAKSNKIQNSEFVKMVHEGLLFGANDQFDISMNPDYKYKGFTSLELLNVLSDTSARRKYFEQNAKYLNTYFSNYEGFSLSLVLGGHWSYIPGKWGYFNDKGKQVIDFIYDDANSFDRGFAEVKFNNKWGVINKKGKVLIPIKYNRLDKVKGKINYKGDVIIPFGDSEKDNLIDYDLFEVMRKNEKGNWKTIGFVDLNGVEYFEEN